MDYYLIIDGFSGSSVARDFEGAFEVQSYTFDFVFDPAGPGEPATADFSPLSLDLALGAALTPLASATTQGLLIRSVQLVGVTPTGVVVYDLKLGNVRITGFSDDAPGPDRLEFAFADVDLTTRELAPDGTPLPPETFRWALERDAPGNSVPAPAPGTGAGAGGASEFYLQIDGLSGGADVALVRGAFAVDGYALDILSEGFGAPRAEFPPLVVDLDLDSSASALLELAATGRVIEAIRLVGFGGLAGITYDLTLVDVRVTRVTDRGTGSDRLEFSYGALDLTTWTVTSSGARGASTSFIWDVETNRTTSPLRDPTAVGPQQGVGPKLDFYLIVAGENGGSDSVGFPGAFEIDDFLLDVQTPDDARPDFGPLVVDLDFGSSLPALTDLLLRGVAIPSIQLIGATLDGVVYELTLGGVSVKRIFDTSAGKDRLEFVYADLELTTRPVNADGSFGPADTIRWNVAGNVQGGPSIPDPVPGRDPASAAVPLDRFLVIDGLDGGSAAEAFPGAFEASGYSFELTSSLAGGSPGGGGGASRPQFGPLVVDLDPAAQIDAIAVLLATGTVVSSIRLAGVTTLGGVAYDLKLEDVVVRALDRGDGTGPVRVMFDYREIELITRQVNADGSFGATETLRWDRAINGPGDGVPDPTPEVANRPPDARDDAFATVEDGVLVGDVTADNGAGPDGDPDGDPLLVTLVEGPAEGSLSLNADGTFVYLADADAFDLATPGTVAEVSFTYRADDGRGGVDTATATIAVTILADGAVITGGPGRNVLTGTDGGEDTISGLEGADVLSGLDGADVLIGGDGADMLFGGEGPDQLFGGNGRDELFGGLGDDRLEGEAAADLLAGDEGDDVLFGGDGADELFGGDGEDRLSGGLGRDVLRGGPGDDELEGGAGGDVFVLALGEGADTFVDFGFGRDRIGLDGLTVANLALNASGADTVISAGLETLAIVRTVDVATLENPELFVLL